MNERTNIVKPVLWVSSSKRDLMDMPTDVITDFGHGLYQAQLAEEIYKDWKHKGGKFNKKPRSRTGIFKQKGCIAVC